MRNQRLGDHHQIWTRQQRINIGFKHGFPLALPDTQFSNRCTARCLHHFAVRGIIERYPYGRCRVQQGLRHCLRRSRLRHICRPTYPATSRVRSALPVFDPAIVAKDRLIAPGVIPGLCGKVIPVFLMSPGPYHDVDARTAAKPFAHAERKSSAIQTRCRLSNEAPVPAGAKIQRPLRRVRYCLGFMISTCFEQENARVSILCQARCNNRAAGPSAADDEVEDIADRVVRERCICRYIFIMGIQFHVSSSVN
ncbi:hypothetical protein N181_26720 [Sinorhizobium fredii USDA 205]|nr:hypothetical protein N181_26720 [Sinorhizobium fredii USDA 205]